MLKPSEEKEIEEGQYNERGCLNLAWNVIASCFNPRILELPDRIEKLSKCRKSKNYTVYSSLSEEVGKLMRLRDINYRFGKNSKFIQMWSDCSGYDEKKTRERILNHNK